MMGAITDRVLETLKIGPMSVHEIAFETGYTKKQVHEVIRVASDCTRMLGKRVYIKEWIKRRTEKRKFKNQLYCAIYALGDRPCAKKPPAISNAERLREKKIRKKKIASNSSIFKLSEAA